MSNETRHASNDILLRLWAKHAPVPFQWPHDEQPDRWIRESIPAVFGIVRIHYGCLDELQAVERERDALRKRVEELEYIRKAMGG